MSDLPRVRKCGKVRTASLVAVRQHESHAGFAGLATCGSIWACPVCNAKVMRVRAFELQCAIATAQERGWFVGMATFTMRHHVGQALAELWDAKAAAWQATVGGRVHVKERERAGFIGYVCATEVTYGPNGWHVHVHVLLFFRERDGLEELAPGMWRRWSSKLRALGFADPLRRGQDWHNVEGPADLELAQYLTKTTAGGRLDLEMSWTQGKAKRGDFGTVPTWELLYAFAETGDMSTVAAWHEWENGSHGRRAHTWSRGLRKLLGLEEEMSDEEIAAQELGTVADAVLSLDGDAWDQVIARPGTAVEILNVVETRGAVAAHEWLASLGIASRLEVDDGS